MSTAEQLRGYRERNARNAAAMIAGPGLARIREHAVELAAETEHGQRALQPRESLRRAIETLDDLAGYARHLADEARKALA